MRLSGKDLDRIVSVHGTMANTCKFCMKDKLKAIGDMLSEDALTCYVSNLQGCSTYDDAASALRQWYNNPAKCPRILTT